MFAFCYNKAPMPDIKTTTNFCSECGRSHQEQSKGARFADRLKTIGKGMTGLVSILFYIFILSFFLGGGGLFGGNQTAPSERLYGSGEDKVAVIDIQGVILEEAPDDPLGLAGGRGTSARGLMKTLEEVKVDKTVKAVVLRVNSPGGAVTASEEIYQNILRFKAETNLPVIISMGDLAASGGYYISVAGDEIIADSTTLTGSIGAIIQSVNFSKLAANYGVEGVTIRSGKNKDLLNPFEETNPEHVAILQTIVDEARGQFVERILTGRTNINREALESLADGRVLSGRQAFEVGLVDKIGSFDDAISVAKDKAGISEATVEVYGQQGLLDSILGAVSTRFSLSSQLGIASLSVLPHGPAYLYLR